jgi:energy-converting hydrogenase Eha subunit F
MLPEDNNADAENNAEFAALKNQVFTLLVALIVVSGTLTVYLYRQASLINKDILQYQMQDQQVSAALAKNESTIGPFVQELMAYGQKHPEFVPVLRKFGLVGNPPVAPKK